MNGNTSIAMAHTTFAPTLRSCRCVKRSSSARTQKIRNSRTAAMIRMRTSLLDERLSSNS
jgi:hypothetical protein